MCLLKGFDQKRGVRRLCSIGWSLVEYIVGFVTTHCAKLTVFCIVVHCIEGNAVFIV